MRRRRTRRPTVDRVALTHFPLPVGGVLNWKKVYLHCEYATWLPHRRENTRWHWDLPRDIARTQLHMSYHDIKMERDSQQLAIKVPILIWWWSGVATYMCKTDKDIPLILDIRATIDTKAGNVRECDMKNTMEPSVCLAKIITYATTYFKVHELACLERKGKLRGAILGSSAHNLLYSNTHDIVKTTRQQFHYGLESAIRSMVEYFAGFAAIVLKENRFIVGLETIILSCDSRFPRCAWQRSKVGDGVLVGLRWIFSGGGAMLRST